MHPNLYEELKRIQYREEELDRIIRQGTFIVHDDVGHPRNPRSLRFSLKPLTVRLRNIARSLLP